MIVILRQLRRKALSFWPLRPHELQNMLPHCPGLNSLARTTMVLCTAGLLGIAGCAPSAAPQAADQAPQYRLTATVSDLMEGLIAPSADALWDSVAYIANAQGIEDRQPLSAEEWQAVRTQAINLMEAANLLSMPGRKVAHDAAHEPPQPGPGELSHGEIQKLIDGN